MNNQRRHSEGTTHEEGQTFRQPIVNVPNPDGEGTTLARLVFRERPYHDDMLLKTHPSKVHFDAFHIMETVRGPVAVLISSMVVDKSVRH